MVSWKETLSISCYVTSGKDSIPLSLSFLTGKNGANDASSQATVCGGGSHTGDAQETLTSQHLCSL